MAEAPMERGGQGNLVLAQSTPTERVEWQAAIYWLYQEDEVSPTARYEKGQLHYTVTDQVGTITELMSETGYI
ncbi:hypothetical protein [Pasteurella dagmatis]|uniref:Uncharacterized protein n=1 Tax=Pasteurella dagmatis ATCC 43325 TaxID=667128 RepID=C9PMI8_9PAST|nr:hypothetical protein [Pasteurella dagmatis]EEX51408.1 hypothetical protein HMPREF0621_0212 [Pasteurella dagmatis ATCC 43325]